ncbi:TetR/AcrR family transcriptional regulator [Streptomyces alkaliterrae]|uniref:TetR family transcriptional regulator n=1 Tax=Streptomyces alkaliterrae TaxID=2213162 RepID=A0A5P0YXH4_9ACTN|nr:TetR/AcrR family transcriptional regulator [Streptomyces alkaliterrae]MBB1255844.1 TetR/AcrR family transcriptional regulator [Streptomyces alkaliterrae]MBB1261886.1 TetR/AcrR family transcriptional regulator [Streptomyces alkaliterrae]MQS04287.1 TetR family transcriptional regulator [Streptomyces alkaliterrae]
MIETSAADIPRPAGRGAARRSELFEELVTLLISEGFAQFTLDDLAARLRCSKRTLYGLAGSKEQLVRAAVVHFFRRATGRVEAALAAESDPAARLAAYLRAVAAELAPASPRFFDDLAAFEPAAEVYDRNTRAAARRVQELIEEGTAAGAFREVHVAFAADVIASVMVRIQRRQVAAATGLSDAEAYAHLAELLLHGLNR